MLLRSEDMTHRVRSVVQSGLTGSWIRGSRNGCAFKCLTTVVNHSVYRCQLQIRVVSWISWGIAPTQHFHCMSMYVFSLTCTRLPENVHARSHGDVILHTIAERSPLSICESAISGRNFNCHTVKLWHSRRRLHIIHVSLNGLHRCVGTTIQGFVFGGGFTKGKCGSSADVLLICQ